MTKMISKSVSSSVSSYNGASNTCILKATIQYTLATKKLDIPLTNSRVVLKDMSFSIYMSTLPSPTMVQTKFNDNRLFVIV